MNTHILKAALFCPSPEGNWGLPLNLKSAPGMGKTHLIKAIAKTLGLPYLRLSPAERGEGYFGCVPVPGPDGHLHYPAPHDVVSAFAERGLLFLDEINCAPPALQAPLLGVVQLRMLGTHQFPAGVRIIAAGNDVADAAGGWDLAPALSNRFGHFDFAGLEASEWVSGLLSGFRPQNTETAVDAAALEAQVMAAWPDAEAEARGLVGGFITRRPELLHKQAVKGSPDRAWPSRRTVEYATVALASAKVHGLSESDTDAFMSGFVGSAWVAEFRRWAEHADLPAPADVLDGKSTFKHSVRHLDRTLAVLGACAALVIPATAAKREPRTHAFWRLVGTVLKDAPDLVVGSARAVLKNGMTLHGDTSQADTLSVLLPILQAAGVGA